MAQSSQQVRPGGVHEVVLLQLAARENRIDERQAVLGAEGDFCRESRVTLRAALHERAERLKVTLPDANGSQGRSSWKWPERRRSGARGRAR